MPSQIVQVKARTVVRQGTLPPLFAGRVRQLYYKLLDEGTVVVTYTFLSPHSAPATRELLVEAADVERGNAPRDENSETDDAYRTRWEAELLPILVERLVDKHLIEGVGLGAAGAAAGAAASGRVDDGPAPRRIEVSSATAGATHDPRLRSSSFRRLDLPEVRVKKGGGGRAS